MIKLENLSKQYGTKTAVAGLSLEIPAGELFAFTGPNGAGKTTTVKMMVGLLKPTSGRVFINDKNIHDQKDYLEAKRMLAYIPDQPFTYDKLSGKEFLGFVGSIYKIEKKLFKDESDKYISMFRMSDYIDQLIETYSLGMKQRLIISASFLHQPEIIVVDEPLVGLDPVSTRIVKELFRSQVKEKGKTIFMSTHLLPIAEEIADKIGIIENGSLIAKGTMNELKKQAKKEGKLEDLFMNLTGQCEVDVSR
jgi:ABC-2 type transport system ATP-binding protein